MKNEIKFRLAQSADLVDIVKMLSDDTIGVTREKFETPLSENYLRAFESIAKDSNQELTIVEMNGIKIGTFQLTFIQYLTHQGALRAQVEAVRIHAQYRGQGIGKIIFEYIIDRAKQKSCKMVQLTSDKQRPDAIRFYEKMGFISTHEGMKLKL